MKRTKSESAKTRQDILDSALQLFVKEGLHQVTLQDIATAANVTRGAVYWHFADKSAIISALFSEVNHSASQIVSEVLKEDRGYIETIKEIFIRQCEYIATHRNLLHLENLALQITAANATDSAFKHLASQTKSTLLTLTQFLQAGIESRQITCAAPATELAKLYLILQKGVINSELLYPDIFRIKDHASQLARIYTDFLTNETHSGKGVSI